MLQTIIHYSMHLILPGLVAWVFFRTHWKKAYLIMLATMLVDLDHVFACSHMFPEEGGFQFISFKHLFECDHIFVADRCSIGFHPLHTNWAIGVYLVLLFFKKTRWAAVGLVLHMISDFQDCLWI